MSKNLEEFKHFKYDDYVYISNMVNSRNLGFNINGDLNSSLALFIDMVNHENEQNTNSRWTYAGGNNLN